MSGRIFVGGFLALAVIFGAALWYFQVFAYYDEVEGLDSIEVAGREIPVTGYTGIDAATSPNKLRACMRIEPSALAGVPLAIDPEPLNPPAWFDCFDAETISADIEAGRATAYLAADETAADATGYEVVRMIAVYPDGRAYLWRHYRETE